MHIYLLDNYIQLYGLYCYFILVSLLIPDIKFAEMSNEFM